MSSRGTCTKFKRLFVQELSFKSKPNVWAYFSVKVYNSLETYVLTG